MRICSFLPTATEMLYALGSGRSVVGRSQHCDYPPQAKHKPVVVASRVARIAKQDSQAIHRAVLALRKQGAHQFTIDVHALRRLKPDVVVTQTICSVCAASHPEVSAAIAHVSPPPKVVTLQAQRIDQVFTEIRQLGAVTHREKTAQRLIRRLQERLERIQESIRETSLRPRIWCCEWMEPLLAAGHWIPEMVELAGGEDGLGIRGADSVWLNWERIRKYDPEVIVVMPCSYTIPQTLRERWRLTQRPGFRSLSAAKRGKVFAVDGSLYHHAGPRLIDGVELFAHLFHPEFFPTAPHRGLFRLF